MRRLLLLLCLLLPAAGRAATRFHLVRVVVTGSTRYSQDDVTRASGLVINALVTQDDLQAAANRLGTSGAFASVEFLFKMVAGTRDGVEADFTVKDAAKSLPAVFENFVWLSDADLRQVLHQALPLYDGSLPLSGTMADDLKAALVRLQTEKGLPADVSYNLFAEMGQPPSAYKFKLENANIKIRDFRFSGAGQLSPELLAKAVSAAKGGDYLRSETEKMLSLTVPQLYREHGYLKVALAEVRPTLEDGAVVVNVAVTEGDQYRLARFSWLGNTLISSDDLSKIITLKPGEPVNASKLDSDLTQARRLFRKFGHESAQIMAKPAFAENNVTYTFEVREGDLYRMGKLEIEGLDAENTRQLLQAWKLSPGSPYDDTYLRQFLTHAVVRIPGRRWEWVIAERLDEPQKTVNVHLQLKIE